MDEAEALAGKYNNHAYVVRPCPCSCSKRSVQLQQLDGMLGAAGPRPVQKECGSASVGLAGNSGIVTVQTPPTAARSDAGMNCYPTSTF